MNFEKFNNLTTSATEGFAFAKNENSKETLKRFLKICESDLNKHLKRTKKKRMAVIDQMEEYTQVLLEGKKQRIKTIVNCLEKMYTLSKDVQGFTLSSFQAKMSGYLNSNQFDEMFNKLKLPKDRKNYDEMKIKEILYYGLDLVDSVQVHKYRKTNPQIDSNNDRLMATTLVMDLIEDKFGINESELIFSEVIEKDQELQKMYSDLAKKLL